MIKSNKMGMILFLCLVFCLGLLTFSPTYIYAQEKQIILKVEHDENVGTITDEVLREAAEKLLEKTNGRVKLEIYPSCSLSANKIPTMISNNQLGATDVAITATSVYSGVLDPRLNVFSLPFIAKDMREMEKLARNSDLAKRLYKEQEKSGIKVIDAWSRALRQFVNRTKEIRTPEDIKGLTFRVPEIKLWVDAWRALGANPIAMPYSEIIMALKTGTIDGAERPTEFLLSEKWWELAKYVTFANYTGDVLIVNFNLKTWEKLPKDIQNVLIETFKEAGDRKIELEEEMEKGAIGELEKHGMKITILTDEEVKMFRDLMKPLWVEYESVIGKDVIEEAVKIVSE